MPEENGLRTDVLSKVLKDTTNAYKHYWFLAILGHIEESDSLSARIDDLAMRMISDVWYPLDYYKLSFGRQDSFKSLANTISTHITVDNKPNSPSLLNQMKEKLPKDICNAITKQVRSTLTRYVIYRFLVPFVEDALCAIKQDHRKNLAIRSLIESAEYQQIVPYQINSDDIIISPAWRIYLRKHLGVLKPFVYWNLVKFLQSKNPKVVGLSEKLHRPSSRNLNKANRFWTQFLNENSTNCIYSGLALDPSSISLDHFIPWSYTVHDELWNIVPTSRAINSTKNDQLPSLERYLTKFCQIQHSAFQFHLRQGNYPLIEDYFTLLGNSTLFPTKEAFYEKLSSEIKNLHRAAQNLGFSDGFIFRRTTASSAI